MRFWLLKIGYCLIIVSWLLVIPAAALDLNGSYENDTLFGFKRGAVPLAGNLNRFRLKIHQQAGEQANLYLEPRYYFFPSTSSVALTGASDLDKLVWDKAYVKVNLPRAAVTVGKQRIAWGSGYIWNPTDVSNPQTLSFAVGEEDETNVEAVRLEVPLGALNSLDGYVRTSSEWRSSVKGVRGKVNVGIFDYAVSYADLGDGDFMIGFDAVGEVFDFGVRNEIAYRSPTGSNVYYQSVWGLDYTLANGLYLNAEYYNNGLGHASLEDYDWDNRILGRDYLYFGLNKSLDEITQLGCSVITNLDDLSYLLYPSFQRSMSDNLDLNIEAMILGGVVGSEYYPPAAQDSFGLGGSKFGLVRFKYSF
ncbi:MAG: hypothetical protein ABH823_00470 [bacterium]